MSLTKAKDPSISETMDQMHSDTYERLEEEQDVERNEGKYIMDE
ncbi:hypothetical protein [Bacillus sp. NPDC093026]